MYTLAKLFNLQCDLVKNTPHIIKSNQTLPNFKITFDVLVSLKRQRTFFYISTSTRFICVRNNLNPGREWLQIYQ